MSASDVSPRWKLMQIPDVIADMIGSLSRWILNPVLGFKIRFRKECRFESGPGHHLTNQALA